MQYAVMLGQHDIVEKLISLKVSVNPKNKEGATPIFWATKKGDLKMVKMLVDAGADIHIVTQGYSLLDMRPSSEEVMEYLESLGVKSAK